MERENGKYDSLPILKSLSVEKKKQLMIFFKQEKELRDLELWKAFVASRVESLARGNTALRSVLFCFFRWRKTKI